MNELRMPPGAVAKAHYHKGIETIAYMLEGECAVYYGDDLQKRLLVQQRPAVLSPPTCRMRLETRAASPASLSSAHSSAAIRMRSCFCLELDVKRAARMPAIA